MVRVLLAIVTWVTMTLAVSSHAETTLSASIDRNKIYETDTLNLLVIGDIDMEFSFNGLMNFGRNQIQAPEIIGLEKDFDILDQQQKYNMQSINGETQAQVTWTYTLAPKRSGTLTIPKAVYKNAESKPIQVSVVKGKAPTDASNPPRVFIETEVDKHQAYVQEQVLYTIRLYAADNLAGGDLSVPESNDAIIETLGETRKYYRMAYNQRYEVRERQYLLFPQKSGELVIAPQTFNGMMIDSRKRRRVRIRESSGPVTIQVKQPPASFTGDIWLPATEFSLSETWDVEPEQIVAGDSFSRTLEINALGLLGSALPPIGMDDSKGLNVYPDQPFVESREHASGANAIRRQTIALVAVSPTTVRLPEIRIPWWDTINDVEQMAIIPARTLNIKPNPSVVSQMQNNTPYAVAPDQTTAVTPSTRNISDSTTGKKQNNAPIEDNNQTLYMIIVLLIIGWLGTTWWLLRHPNRTIEQGRQAKPNSLPGNPYQQLLDAIKKDQADMPKHLVQWVQLMLTQTSRTSSGSTIRILSLHDLENVDQELYQLALAYEQQLYSQIPDKGGYDKKRMLQCIKKLVAKKNRSNRDTTPLAPLYPK